MKIPSLPSRVAVAAIGILFVVTGCSNGESNSTKPKPDAAPTSGNADAAPEAQSPDGKTAGADAGREDGVPGLVGPDAKITVPDISPDSGKAPADAKSDASGEATFMPPMPNVDLDPTLGDTTDFGTSAGFKIILDYRYDDGKFMTAERRKVVRAAAASWEQFIGSDFTAIPAGTSIRTRDPENADGGMNVSVTYPIDDLVVFIGSSKIDGKGGTLAGAYSSLTVGGMPAELSASLNQRYKGNPFQPWVATVVFDIEEDAFADTTLDTANDIPSSATDLYSTALHELGHVLGTGQSAAYLALVSNATFTGAKSEALYGGPVPLTSDGKHVLKTVIFDGRRLVMDQSDAAGDRSYITRLDLAMLEDQGYTIRR